MLTLINCNKNNKINKKLEQKKKKALIYKKLFEEYLYEDYLQTKQHKIKTIFHGVKYIILFPLDTETTYKEFLLMYNTIQDIICLMKDLSLKDLINMFPIIKEYDGEKWEAKDYYSTMEYLQDKNLEEPIGEEIYNFFFNYYNNDIINFSVKHMLLIDRINKAECKPSLMEQFLEIADPEGKIHTYTYHKKEGYMYDNYTGKTFKVSKPKRKIPKYLKILK